MSIDQYIASIPQIQERGDWLTYATTYHRLTDRGLVLTLASEVESDSGVELDGPRLVLFLVRDSLVSLMEWFDVDALDAALARFDELTAVDEEVLARRDGYLSLTRVTSPDGVEYVVEDTQAGWSERFAESEYDDAVRALDARSLAAADPEVARWMTTAIELAERMRAGEFEDGSLVLPLTETWGGEVRLKMAVRSSVMVSSS